MLFFIKNFYIKVRKRIFLYVPKTFVIYQISNNEYSEFVFAYIKIPSYVYLNKYIKYANIMHANIINNVKYANKNIICI